MCLTSSCGGRSAVYGNDTSNLQRHNVSQGGQGDGVSRPAGRVVLDQDGGQDGANEGGAEDESIINPLNKG